MSRNAEIVRRVFEGVAAVGAGRDAADAFDLVAEDFELIPATEVPGVGRSRGLAGFTEFMRTWTEAFETWFVDLEDVIEIGDDRVVAVMHQGGTGKGSGAPVDLRYAGILRFEDGRLVETRLFMTVAEAWDAAGVTPLAAEGSTAYAERGREGLAQTWHEDVVYEEDPLFPGSGTYRGRDAVLARFREYEEQLGPTTVSTERIVEGTSGAVVIWKNSGVTSSAGMPFEHRWAWLIQGRDGKVAHIRAYFDPDEALRAVEARAT